MPTIALIEDDVSFGESLVEFLSAENFKIVWKKSLNEAEQINWVTIDLVLLDWRLPDGDGIDLLPKLKKFPVIFLTARDTVLDKVLALESGAKDYLAKPFDPRELLARIRVQLRSHTLDGDTVAGALRLNARARTATYSGRSLNLTKMEFDLLMLLAQHPGRAFSREELLNKVWGFDQYPSTRTVDTHVLQLRQKTSNELIKTVHKIGYQLNPEFDN